LAITAAPALGAAGGLDPSFSGDGKLALGSSGESAVAVAVEPDGKIVVAGTTAFAQDIVVTRMNPDGSLDPTFDVDGTAIIDNSARDIATALALRPDGKILVAGSTGAGTINSFDAAVWRLKANGGTQNTPNDALDPTFDVDGKAIIDSGGDEKAYALAVQPDGKIVIAGSTSAGAGGGNAAVYRLKANGGTQSIPNDALDHAFDTDGAAGIDSGGTEVANAVALQPDGKILIAGWTSNGTGGSDAVVYRLKADGGTGAINDALDPSFDTDGAAGIDSGGDERANALALLPDGKITIAGYTTNATGGGDAVVYRLMPNGGTGVLNGALDPSFDVDGAARIDTGGFDDANALGLQPDGKIILAGSASGATGSGAAIWRLQANGGTLNAANDALDPSFGTDGAALLDNGGGKSAFAAALMPDRRIVIAGSNSIATGDAAVYRLFGDPFTLTASKPGAGSGTVSSSPAGIDCGATCAAPFDDATSVTLTAHPAAGSMFSGWSGSGCSGTGTCTVVLAADRNVSASFALSLPNTKISKAKINQAKNSAKFKFKAAGSAKATTSSGFQCALVKRKKHRKPKVKFKHCESPKRYKHLEPARYTFEVRAFSAAGKDPTPAKKKFRIKP
jgi:uncharacterized delta-60 repeat protein